MSRLATSWPRRCIRLGRFPRLRSCAAFPGRDALRLRSGRDRGWVEPGRPRIGIPIGLESVLRRRRTPAPPSAPGFFVCAFAAFPSLDPRCQFVAPNTWACQRERDSSAEFIRTARLSSCPQPPIQPLTGEPCQTDLSLSPLSSLLRPVRPRPSPKPLRIPNAPPRDHRVTARGPVATRAAVAEMPPRSRVLTTA
jgi:hypothetical protein